jgi:DNA-binding response OmpR family regulator
VAVTVTNKVLVVDDDPDARIFISNLLASHGFDPVLAETRADGFRKAIDQNPAVIIIDMMMIGEGGIQMYQDLKRDKKLQHVPVIMLATIDRKSFFQWHKIRRSNFPGEAPDIYLEKPIEAEELIRITNKLIRAEAVDRVT